MKNEYVVLNGIQSHLLTWGNPFHSNGQDIIVCITGNPGIVDFYEEFASELHESTRLPICLIGQAGHDVVPDKKSNCLKGQEDLFNLQGQIKHKLELINNYIDKQCNIHLVGHSIGGWLILELLQNDIDLNKRIKSINLLFPTLYQMASTRNGKFMNNVIRRLNWLLILFCQLLDLLPTFILSIIGQVYLKLNSLPSHYLARMLKFIHPKVVEKILFLAYNEMDNVKKLNIQMLDNVKHLTNIIYTDKDDWAPATFMDDMRIFQPPLQMQLVCAEHAFVVKSSKFVAEMVSQFIKPRAKQIDF